MSPYFTSSITQERLKLSEECSPHYSRSLGLGELPTQLEELNSIGPCNLTNETQRSLHMGPCGCRVDTRLISTVKTAATARIRSYVKYVKGVRPVKKWF